MKFELLVEPQRPFVITSAFFSKLHFSIPCPMSWDHVAGMVRNVLPFSWTISVHLAKTQSAARCSGQAGLTLHAPSPAGFGAPLEFSAQTSRLPTLCCDCLSTCLMFTLAAGNVFFHLFSHLDQSLHNCSVSEWGVGQKQVRGKLRCGCGGVGRYECVWTWWLIDSSTV